MAINWNKIPDSTVKYELQAFERQLEAVENAGPTIHDMAVVCLQFRQMASHVMEYMQHLLTLRLYDSIESYKNAVDRLLDRMERMNEALSILSSRKLTGEEPVKN